MKYLGIDYGEKRVGLAFSDDSNSFAFPLIVLENTTSLLDEIRGICTKQSISEIVVGESKNFEQGENKIMNKIKPFVGALADHTGLSVHLHPEFLSSLEAKQIQGKNSMLDASAAAIILKSYLDVKNNQTHT